MENLHRKIRELLQRNLILGEDIRRKILENLPTLPEINCKKIIKILEVVDQKQTETFQKNVEKDPFYFHHLEQVILDTMKKEFLKIETTEQTQAEEALRLDLSQYQEKAIIIQ